MTLTLSIRVTMLLFEGITIGVLWSSIYIAEKQDNKKWKIIISLVYILVCFSTAFTGYKIITTSPPNRRLFLL